MITKFKAITDPSQMPRPLVYDEALKTKRTKNRRRLKDVWWARDGIVKPANKEEAEKMEKMFVLRDKLLSFGGAEACMPIIEEDYDNIMNRGQLFYGKGTHFRKGEPCRCHSNACYLWEANKGRCQIATGYALSSDGIWRQHSWVVQPIATKWRVWETTEPRVAYFGFIMDDDECEQLYEQCTW